VDLKVMLPAVWALDPRTALTLLIVWSIWRLEDR
jgi:hypothetical protein